MKSPPLHYTFLSLTFERVRVNLIFLTDTSECKPFPISSSFKFLAFSSESNILFMHISTWIPTIPLYSHAILHWELVDLSVNSSALEYGLFEAMQMWNITNIIVSITVVLLYGIIAVKMLCHCEFSQLIHSSRQFLARGTEENTAKAKFTRGVVKSATVLTIFFSASW